MKTDLYSISKIFTERLLRIPDYQRGYAWTNKHLKDYWNDLVQLEKGRNHYVGVVTLEETPDDSLKTWTDDHWIIDAKSFAPYHVVDGQQRLTTTIILIQSICEVVGENAELNFTTVKEIRKKYIFDSKDGGISRSYVFGYEKDNPSYNYLKAKIFNEKINESFPLEETIYTQNLLNAKEYFVDKLRELELEYIETLYTKVTQNFLFAIYSMSDDIDVYITFETMNNRGKPLSHLELLKNRLIYLTTKFESEACERSRLRKTINDCWRAIYHYLGKNKDNQLDDDVFLFNHFILYFGTELSGDKSDSMRSIRHGYRFGAYKEYLLDEKFTVRNVVSEKTLSLTDVDQYVKSLKQSVDVWYQLLNPEDSEFDKEVIQWLSKLKRLGSNAHLPLIMVYFQVCTDTKKRVSLLIALEQLSFCLSLVGYLLNIDDTLFIDLANSLRSEEVTSDDVIKDINKRTEDFMTKFDFMKLSKSRFNKSGFYNWRGLRYFLYEYEMNLKESSKSHHQKLNWELFSQDDRDHVSIEHIYPQKPLKACWKPLYKDLTPTHRKKLKHSLGNLVPLSKPKNSSLGNKCFDEKKSNEKNTVGYIYGCFSENEVAHNKEWGPKEIIERGEKMIKFMEKRWSLKIENRIAFLGLDAVSKKLVKNKINQK